MLDVVLPVPGSPSCCPSLSVSLLLVQMQQKSIIIFSLFKLGLAEPKMNLLSEGSALLRTAPDAAWVLISMPGNSGCREVINAEATEAVYCHPQLGEQLLPQWECLPGNSGLLCSITLLVALQGEFVTFWSAQMR